MLIHAAIERPAVNKISVATIGWILKYATNTPLNTPQSIAAIHPTKNATIIGAPLEPLSIRSTTLPLTAIVAPTLISWPPEAAVTKVIPIARIASSEP